MSFAAIKGKFKIGLLPKIVIAIFLGIICAKFFPLAITRIFITFNVIFGNFLGFIIPLIILGLVAPGIAELGKGAGKLLGITALIAYTSTILAGFFSYYTCAFSYPMILDPSQGFNSLAGIESVSLEPYINLEIPATMSVTTSLVLAFVLGLALTAVQGNYLKNVLTEFRDVITLVITKLIIPFLPLYIFSIFLKISAEGQAGTILKLFIKVIIIIFIMHVLLLLIQFAIAGLVAKKNPIKALINMLPAYFTALGTQSSAATIPVTLERAKKNGVKEDLAGFVIPLCATIHLSGSTLKIVACAFAILWMQGMPCGIDIFAGFIFMLGITMVAAPGVPGGAIMATLGLLSTMLGFDETLQGLMIALYITMDSFGTACNVTGDGAIALILNRIYAGKTN
jgi:Na+/H+-dicarboxylate symporters